MKYILGISALLIGIGLVLFSIRELTITRTVADPVSETTASPTASPAEKDKETTILSAWIQPPFTTNSIQRIPDTKRALHIIHPIFYRINESGEIEQTDPQNQKLLIQTAEEETISIVPAIVNLEDPKRTQLFLLSPEKQQRLIATLRTEAEQYGYSGFDIVFDNVPAEHGEDFTAFVGSLHKELLTSNLVLSVTIPAKTGKPTDHEMTKVYDWKALTEIADTVRVSFIFNEIQKTHPNTIEYFKECLSYALTIIPKSKLALALPAFSKIQSGQKTETLTFAQTELLLKKLNSTPERNKETQQLTADIVENGISKTLIINDSESIRFKILLAKNRGIHQFSLWTLGNEDIRIWSEML